MASPETNQRILRLLIPFVVGMLVLAIALPSFFSKPKPQTQGQTATQPATSPAGVPDSAPAPQPQQPAVRTAPDQTFAATQPSTGFHAVPVDTSASTATGALGSLDPRVHQLFVNTTRVGGGISAIRFSNIWQTAKARHKADAYLKNLDSAAAFDTAQVDDALRYTMHTSLKYTPATGAATFTVPLFAAYSVQVNGTTVSLFDERSWAESKPGVFTATIADPAGKAVLRITRTFAVGKTYEIALQQQFENLSDQPIEIVWRQYGPPEAVYDPTSYASDARRLDIGYRPEPVNYPALVLSDDSSQSFDHSTLLSRRESRSIALWPNDSSVARTYDLTWFASIDRYFGLAVHPAADSATPTSLSPQIQRVDFDMTVFAGSATPPTAQAMTFLTSPMLTIAPQQHADINMGIYAGPLKREMLKADPYGKLALADMIVYSMGGMCAFCTFQWLANILIWYLSFLHNYIAFDWALAIIGLVITVRAILHPLTKRSQINMTRFGKKMAALKPEIEKLQKKHGNEPKKMQQEQLRLMREHGVNPLQMLGCLPLFLQTPIWIALYAVLYLAFELRHQAAFFGVFQLFGGWAFLGDLSSQDTFIPLGAGFTIPLLNTQITAINLLPILMGVVFFVQQKYLTPQSAATMTPEQQSQQRIMKWMMVVLFPLMMFKAPSGLTLYIITSSIIGIMESRYVRAHIEELDKNPPPDRPAKFKPKGAKGHAYASLLERLEQKRREAAERSFKKRK